MDNIQATFTYTLWIENFYWYCIYMIHFNEDFRYYCSSNSNHLVQIENWTRCDVWTIFSPRCTNTLWISNFHCNCICIFHSMKIYQILLQFQLKPFSSNWKLNTMWCMDNIQSHFINTLWTWNFHCNCICIFNSMKIYQILLQLRLKEFKLKIEFIVMHGQYSVHIL